MRYNSDMGAKAIKVEMIILSTILAMGLIIPESVEWKVIVASMMIICPLTGIVTVILDKKEEE